MKYALSGENYVCTKCSTLAVEQILLVIQQWGFLSLTPPSPEYSDDTRDRADGYFETLNFLKSEKWGRGGGGEGEKGGAAIASGECSRRRRVATSGPVASQWGIWGNVYTASTTSHHPGNLWWFTSAITSTQGHFIRLMPICIKLTTANAHYKRLPSQWGFSAEMQKAARMASMLVLCFSPKLC